jgi:hypothetical protein
MNTAPGRSSRALLGGAVLLLVACLVADMATPVLPGAFRLSPSESIEAAAGRADLARVVPVDQLLARVAPDVPAPPMPRASRSTADGPPPREASRGPARPSHTLAPTDPATASDDD